MTIPERENNYQSNDNQPPAHLFRYISLIIIALLLVIFAIQNSHEVTIHLWFWVFRTSLALGLVICVIFGFVLSLIYFYPTNRRKKKKQKEQYPNDRSNPGNRYSGNF
ncbi:MAG: lipopolysaccharide assembly protein LapA domain-containing protein [Bacteroidales bacterium]